jgi:hypothetical protein
MLATAALYENGAPVLGVFSFGKMCKKCTVARFGFIW